MSRVLIIVGDATETVDTLYPYYRLIEGGYQPVIAAPEKRRYQMVLHEVQPGWTITREWEGYSIEADVSFNEIKEKVDDKEISLFHIPGAENPSDILTKPLPRVTHNKHMDTVLNDSSFVNETAKVVFELRNPNGC